MYILENDYVAGGPVVPANIAYAPYSLCGFQFTVHSLRFKVYSLQRELHPIDYLLLVAADWLQFL